ncbi:hypothetical protein CDD82_1048 [Ophiocordyceps australis]|uniref:MMS19 nucleotide excision repair protein n=1 Tax=Ophiocordyceps australis TaxID=1399860 RepID=A0A2C5ZPF9_9HYPO|nr:hypothetical protein CDD82_1048 [Ophiocordyceps australis]
MADFRQLALEFVLEEDETKLSKIAQRAASDIQSAPANSNPVARWVEAVHPWIPGNSDAVVDEPEATEWTSRAKALEFLSRTLDFLSKDTLKPSQLKLLIAFFGAMFDVDHKAGIMASATALSRIITAKSFQPQSGVQIIQKVCALKDDFPRQLAKTRLAVYHLLHSLVTDTAVASHLNNHNDHDSYFMTDLLRLCDSERDPDCLMVWFDTLTYFLANYSPPSTILEHVYGKFKAYFPITLPRASLSGVTPDQLKTQLRSCFSSNYQLAPFTLPFLLEKIDQGDGVTVNVKMDILRTMKACVEQYNYPQESVAPYVDRIWNCLKYEVRNGEIEDTIWATLEVLKALTMRLTGDNRRDYSLTVTRDCAEDFSSSTYTAPAGRLIVSVMSSSVGAFVLMVTPAITHIKENLRHPKSSVHSSHLIKILRVILETRQFLANTDMTNQDRRDFAAVDAIISTLYGDVYQNLIQGACNDGVEREEVTLLAEAVQGVGALVCQRALDPLGIVQEQGQKSNTSLLLSVSIYVEICDSLFNIACHSDNEHFLSPEFHQLLNQVMTALRNSIEAYPPGFKSLIKTALQHIRETYVGPTAYSAQRIGNLASILAFTGCSTLSPSLENAMENFLRLSLMLLLELMRTVDAHLGTEIWCALATGLQVTAYYVKDSCRNENAKTHINLDTQLELGQDFSFTSLIAKYPVLKALDTCGTGMADFVDQDLRIPVLRDASEFRQDFLIIALFYSRHLYRKTTKPVELNNHQGKKMLALSDDFNGSNHAAEVRYLRKISDYASLVIAEINSFGQHFHQLESYYLTLFQDDFISISDSFMSQRDSYPWLNMYPLNILSLGILKSLLPSNVKILYDAGIAQKLIIDGVSCRSKMNETTDDFQVTAATLAVLANKYKLEAHVELMATIEESLQSAFNLVTSEFSPEDGDIGLRQASIIFTLAGSLLRRRTGPEIKGLVKLMREAPCHAKGGYDLARALEATVTLEKSITNSAGFIQSPLWMQKLYVDLVKPMISKASETKDSIIRNNYGVAILHVVKHMNFPIYEDDISSIVRNAIAVCQTASSADDALAALELLRTTMMEMPEAEQDHLHSIVNICIAMFSQEQHKGDARVLSKCGKLALEIVGHLPRVFESSKLLALSPLVQRGLAAACGHGVRQVRSTARVARAAWVDVK